MAVSSTPPGNSTCPSSNKWNRRSVLLKASFVPHFQFTQRVVGRANGIAKLTGGIGYSGHEHVQGHCQTNWFGPVEPTIEVSQTAS